MSTIYFTHLIMCTIYALKLQSNKYYIGKTTANILVTLEDHTNNNASQWTKIYKPVDLIELIKNCDEYDEDKYTIKYMSMFGIDNVRGGSFCDVKLDDFDIRILNKMINNAKNKCPNYVDDNLINNYANINKIVEEDKKQEHVENNLNITIEYKDGHYITFSDNINTSNRIEPRVNINFFPAHLEQVNIIISRNSNTMNCSGNGSGNKSKMCLFNDFASRDNFVKIFLKEINNPLSFKCQGCFIDMKDFESLHNHKINCTKIWILDEHEKKVHNNAIYISEKGYTLYIVHKQKEIYYMYSLTWGDHKELIRMKSYQQFEGELIKRKSCRKIFENDCLQVFARLQRNIIPSGFINMKSNLEELIKDNLF